LRWRITHNGAKSGYRDASWAKFGLLVAYGFLGCMSTILSQVNDLRTTCSASHNATNAFAASPPLAEPKSPPPCGRQPSSSGGRETKADKTTQSQYRRGPGATQSQEYSSGVNLSNATSTGSWVVYQCGYATCSWLLLFFLHNLCPLSAMILLFYRPPSSVLRPPSLVLCLRSSRLHPHTSLQHRLHLPVILPPRQRPHQLLGLSGRSRGRGLVHPDTGLDFHRDVFRYVQIEERVGRSFQNGQDDGADHGSGRCWGCEERPVKKNTGISPGFLSAHTRGPLTRRSNGCSPHRSLPVLQRPAQSPCCSSLP
jgi:hypothetical protein